MNLEKMAIKVTEKVLDDLLYKGKTLREWIDLIIKFEKEQKQIDERFICNTCKHKYGCPNYGIVKRFLDESPVNHMSCNVYEKEI